MTAREFAAAIDRPYSTVALWLRQKKIPGAYQESVGDFSVWQIPPEAIEGFTPPVLGRPPKSLTESQSEEPAAKSVAAKPKKKLTAKKSAKKG